MTKKLFKTFLLVCLSLQFLVSHAQTSSPSCETIQMETVGSELVITGMDKGNTKVTVYDDNYQQVHACEFNCAETINIPNVSNGAIYHLTFQFFNKTFQYVTEEQRDYEIGSSALNINICTEEVSLLSQAEVNAFCGCELVLEDLLIGNTEQENDITDISKLSTIKKAGREVKIIGTQLTDLSDLSGLLPSYLFIHNNSRLTQINSFNEMEESIFISIFNNDQLTEINGFKKLKKLEFSLSFNDNDQLTRLNGFEQLEEARRVGISNNATLKTFDELPNLRDVIEGELVFFNNPSLEIIDLPNLLSVDRFRLIQNEQLNTVTKMENLTIPTRLEIIETPALEDCCFISNLIDYDPHNGELLGELVLRSNEQLCRNREFILASCSETPPIADCDLMELTSTGNQLILSGINAPNATVKIFDHNWQLIFDCNGACDENITLSNLVVGDTYHTDIQFYDENWQLICQEKQDKQIGSDDRPCPPIICDGNLTFRTQAEVDAFCGCEVINGFLTIGISVSNSPDEPTDIVSLAPLSNLKEVKHGVQISRTSLTDLSDLSQLEAVLHLSISGNPNMTSLNGLQKLTTTGSFSMDRNPNLKDISALSQLKNLTSILFYDTGVNSLEVFSNADITNLINLNINLCNELESLTGLEGVQTVQSTHSTGLGLSRNEKLKDISALRNLMFVNKDFNMVGNPLVTDCCAIAHLLDADDSNGKVTGNINIKENPFECNTVEAILENCNLTSSGCQDIDVSSTNNELIISGITAPIAIVKVFNKNYQLVFECNNNCEETITLSNLTADEFYHIDIQFYSRDWQFICEVKQSVTIAGGGNPCDNINITYENNELTITGLTAPREITKVFDEDWQQIYDCFNNCEEAITLSNLSGAAFHIRIATYDEDWNFLCHGDEDLSVTEDRNIDNYSPEDFTLSPNPVAYDEVYLDLNRLKGEGVTLNIVNQFGQTVYQKALEEVVNTTEKIDLTDVSNGLYLLQIQPKGKRAITKKLIVSRLY